MVKVKEEMKKAKAEMEKNKIEMKLNSEKLKLNMKEAMGKAKESMEKVKVEIQHLKEFTNELEKDRLIDKKKPFKIEVKDGELYINDKKQTKEVIDKYRKYFKKDNFTITSGGNEKGVSI